MPQHDKEPRTDALHAPNQKDIAMKRLATLIALVALQGCDVSNSGVKGANGETPVRYVICGVGETNCFVLARFKDLDSCESHKQWADMLCDRASEPGKMTCTTDTSPQIAIAYCTL